MRVIQYFSADHQEYWLSKIKESDWVAGQFLHDLLKNKALQQYSGENSKVLMLVEDDRLISFCTLSDTDDIEATDLKPWIGFVYTFPQYRGNRYFGKLLNYVANLAKSDGFQNLYISTDQEGIYENYDFHFIGIMKDRRGGDSRVYVRPLQL